MNTYMGYDLQTIWNVLIDVPIDNQDRTETYFLHFPPGTNRFEIWHWIEETFDVSIDELRDIEDQLHCGS